MNDDAADIGPTHPDPYVGVPEVTELDQDIFDKFIRSKDATMVFFYKEPMEYDSELAKSTIIKAARKTKRKNHAYGAVNCTANSELCTRQEILSYSTPVFKLYAGGHAVNRYQHDVSYKDIRKFVEKSPMRVPERIFRKMCSCIGC